MSVYSRFKKDPEAGFRALIELLESTSPKKRQKMIDVGMEEDADYTSQALLHMFRIEDIMGMDDLNLAELLAAAPPKTSAYAISQASDEVKKHFLKNCVHTKLAEFRDLLETPDLSPQIVEAAQLKLIEVARSLERNQKLTVKRIPMYRGPTQREPESHDPPKQNAENSNSKKN